MKYNKLKSILIIITFLLIIVDIFTRGQVNVIVPLFIILIAAKIRHAKYSKDKKSSYPYRIS